MKIAFYCRVDGQGFGFVLPDEELTSSANFSPSIRISPASDGCIKKISVYITFEIENEICRTYDAVVFRHTIRSLPCLHLVHSKLSLFD